jgi:hypothetical protein
MTKLEAWKKFHEAMPGLEATEYTLEKSSHGKAFSYAWDAAVEAEREACAKICEKYQLDFVARDIRKRGEPDASTALQSIQQQ